ncbi:hypothetical protein M8J76_002396 [Diaphorina citri]|nr:hypothetical protein M8J76_002396 [Diaphorina citri]
MKKIKKEDKKKAKIRRISKVIDNILNEIDKSERQITDDVKANLPNWTQDPNNDPVVRKRGGGALHRELGRVEVYKKKKKKERRKKRRTERGGGGGKTKKK